MAESADPIVFCHTPLHAYSWLLWYKVCYIIQTLPCIRAGMQESHTLFPLAVTFKWFIILCECDKAILAININRAHRKGLKFCPQALVHGMGYLFICVAICVCLCGYVATQLCQKTVLASDGTYHIPRNIGDFTPNWAFNKFGGKSNKPSKCITSTIARKMLAYFFWRFQYGRQIAKFISSPNIPVILYRAVRVMHCKVLTGSICYDSLSSKYNTKALQ